MVERRVSATPGVAEEEPLLSRSLRLFADAAGRLVRRDPSPTRSDRRRWDRQLHLVMVGDDVRAGGGMAAVAEIYRRHGLFEARRIVYVPTYVSNRATAMLWHFAKAFANISRQLAYGNVSGLHIHTAARGSFWRNLSIAGLAKLFGKPYILHVHDGYFAVFYQHQGKLRKRLVLWALGAAHRVVCLTRSWGDVIQAIDSRIAVSVVPNPVVPDVATLQRRTPDRIANGLVLFLGRLNAQKGVIDLLDAAAHLAGDFPRLRLVLAGDGETELVQEMIRERGLADRVELPGWVSGSTRADLLSRAQILVLPSHFEGLPMAILEAMELGIPVVATRVGGIPDIVRNGVDGYLVPPRDTQALAEALARLLRNPEHALELGRSGRARVHQHFLPEHVLPQIERIYDDVFISMAGPDAHASRQR